MGKRRVAVLLTIVAAIGTACGLGLQGVESPAVNDAGDDAAPVDAHLPDAGDFDGAALDDSGPIDFPIDADVDVSPTNCAAACDGGICDGGWCTFPCTTANACQGSAVTCPPGIPCSVDCSGTGACNKGVDCQQASACEVKCTGHNACQGDAVLCSGSVCTVACGGVGTCNKGASCDAGICDIGCGGSNSCRGGPVACDATRCRIQCGLGDGGGAGSCNQTVSCTAEQDCVVACTDTNTCSKVGVTAGGNANVLCSAGSTCDMALDVSAGDAGVRCSGGPNVCQSGIFCDGGKCAAACTGNAAFTFCCKSGTCTNSPAGACTFNAAGCPP